MFYLLWALLNIGLHIFFIVICFKATKLIRAKIGLFAAIVFVFGFLSFVSGADSEPKSTKAESPAIDTWKYVPEDSLTEYQRPLNAVLQKNLISKYLLTIRHGKDQQGNNIPISAFAFTNGIISGTEFIPMWGTVNRTKDNDKFSYDVSAIIQWKLLGATIFRQFKKFKGVASLN